MPELSKDPNSRDKYSSFDLLNEGPPSVLVDYNEEGVMHSVSDLSYCSCVGSYESSCDGVACTCGEFHKPEPVEQKNWFQRLMLKTFSR